MNEDSKKSKETAVLSSQFNHLMNCNNSLKMTGLKK